MNGSLALRPEVRRRVYKKLRFSPASGGPNCGLGGRASERVSAWAIGRSTSEGRAGGRKWAAAEKIGQLLDGRRWPSWRPANEFA